MFLRALRLYQMKKQRLDVALVERGLVETRSKAQSLIMARRILVNGQRVDKAGASVAEDDELAIEELEHPWVGRGGMKLAHALREFGISVEGKTCADIGASTGGFTDVLLQNGAARVYAIDVGYGQLDASLRNDPRVVVREKVNARYLDETVVPEPVGVLVCDASFIGLQTVLGLPLKLCAPGAWAVALIKPQFEAGPAAVGKGGVVRDPAVHRHVCAAVTDWWRALPGWSVKGLTESPITGPEGNREFLIAARYTP